MKPARPNIYFIEKDPFDEKGTDYFKERKEFIASILAKHSKETKVSFEVVAKLRPDKKISSDNGITYAFTKEREPYVHMVYSFAHGVHKEELFYPGSIKQEISSFYYDNKGKKVLHGNYTAFHENGVEKETRYYQNGIVQNHTVKIHDKSGYLVEEIPYDVYGAVTGIKIKYASFLRERDRKPEYFVTELQEVENGQPEGVKLVSGPNGFEGSFFQHGILDATTTKNLAEKIQKHAPRIREFLDNSGEFLSVYHRHEIMNEVFGTLTEKGRKAERFTVH